MLGDPDDRIGCSAASVIGAELFYPKASQTGPPALVRQAFLAALAALDALEVPEGPEEQCSRRVAVDVPARTGRLLLRTVVQRARARSTRTS